MIGKKVFIPSTLRVAFENLIPHNLLAAAKFQRYSFEVRNYFSSK